MSKGIRIYFHASNKRVRDCYNYWAGQDEIDLLVNDRYAKIIAVGTEGGAMCLHYRRI